MAEWAIIVIFGASGGAVSTLFVGGTNIPLPELWAGIEESRYYRPYRFVQNTFLGAVASFLVWSTGSGVSFASAGIEPIQVAQAVISGGGGGAIVNAFFQRAQDQRIVSDLASALEEVVGQE